MGTPTGEIMAVCEHHHVAGNCVTCLRAKLEERDNRIERALKLLEPLFHVSDGHKEQGYTHFEVTLTAQRMDVIRSVLTEEN